MSLGENIYRFRTAHHMSQGDLADALEVSRQSISKWETDGSVPELDKLVKLAELFEVTLDELVTGQVPVTPEPTALPQAGLSAQKLVAIVLMCMAFLVVLVFTVIDALVMELIFSVPLLTCALICFLAKKHPGLWCGWAVIGLTDLYLRWATGLSWATVRWTFQWEWSWNYTRLLIAWCQFLAGLVLLAVTALILRKTARTPSKKHLFLGLTAFVLLCLPWPVWIFQVLGQGGAVLITLVGWLQDFLRLGLLSWFIAALLAWRRVKKQPI